MSSIEDLKTAFEEGFARDEQTAKRECREPVEQYVLIHELTEKPNERKFVLIFLGITIVTLSNFHFFSDRPGRF